MTVKQMQCLLAYLGFYGGALDGLWGALSAGAERDFRAAYGLSCEELGQALLDAVAGRLQKRDPFQGVRWFSKEEFRCKCGRHCDGFPAEVDGKLLALADQVRDHFGAAALVSSGLRCQVHNQNVGGVEGSRHLVGKAMDFRIRGKGSAAVLAFVQSLPGVRYAYAIDSAFVHMDVE